ncbi:hypothetical protein PENTCL1PPCAC_12031, partial [Pristionchus entomophagus]
LLTLPFLVAGVVAHDALLVEAGIEVEGRVSGSVQVNPEAMGVLGGYSDDANTVAVTETIDRDGDRSRGMEVFSGEV